MADNKKQGSDFFAEDDPGMEKHREAGQQGGEAQNEDQNTEYFSKVTPLREQDIQEENEPNTREQSEDEMEDI